MATAEKTVDDVIENIYKDVHPFLNERQKRKFWQVVLLMHMVLVELKRYVL